MQYRYYHFLYWLNVKHKNRMKKFILITIAMLVTFKIQAQTGQTNKQAVALNKEICKIIKKNSLFTDVLNWKDIETENKSLVFMEDDFSNEQMIYDFYTKKLREIGDKHSFFISSKKISEISNTAVVEHPQGEYLGNGIGWIKVPRLITFDENKDIQFADTIRSIIEKIDTDNTITGWIVDLRHNGGGNMWPMIAGLNALIDDATAGYFVQGKLKVPWSNNNGTIYGKPKPINTYKIKNNKVKIAVLFDANTGSSGEMTVVSFLGLPNVKTFGQKSAGYTTANSTFRLSNGGQLLLARTYIMDRTGKSYKGEITPDVTVPDLSNTKNDNVIKTAVEWLSE